MKLPRLRTVLLAPLALLEVAARGDEFANGDKLGTRRIIGYSGAYRLSKPIS